MKIGKSKNIPHAPAPRTRIRTRILAGFLLFTLVIAALLWVFQILLLNTFYSAIKKNEVSAAATRITENLETDNLNKVLEELIVTNNINFLISTEKGKRLYYSKNNFTSNILENYSPYNLIDIFNFTQTSGGEYIDNYDLPVGGTEIRHGIVLSSTPKLPSGNHYLILLDVQITPVDSTIETLKILLICVTMLMIILGTALAVWISRRLTKPIEAINQSAKQMAAGDYSIRFAETGSRETCELAQTLNQTAVELSKVEALRHELLANISHDLRTPLTMIRGYSEVMRDLPGENTPENVQIIIDEATRLNALVDDLLNLSRLEAGVTTLQLTVFNITESIRETIKRYEKLSDFTFIFEPQEDLLVKADRLKISQVIYNLLNNAINYSREEKVITILQERKLENYVRISVIDRGEGIPQDKLKDIWERYFKIDKEHRQSQTGTGIGLSIVKNVLALHGGHYGVTSEENTGSTFWFELPLAAENEDTMQNI